MEDGDQIIKKFMYMNRKSPYGTIYALESLEAVSYTHLTLPTICSV